MPPQGPPVAAQEPFEHTEHGVVRPDPYAWLRRLDIAQGTFKKSEPTLQSLPMRASEYVHRQIGITPFPTEPVGWLIEQCGDDLFLFSSDNPHPEGGKDPLARFESSMAGVGDDAKAKFYSGNFADMLGMAPVSA